MRKKSGSAEMRMIVLASGKVNVSANSKELKRNAERSGEDVRPRRKQRVSKQIASSELVARQSGRSSSKERDGNEKRSRGESARIETDVSAKSEQRARELPKRSGEKRRSDKIDSIAWSGRGKSESAKKSDGRVKRRKIADRMSVP